MTQPPHQSRHLPATTTSGLRLSSSAQQQWPVAEQDNPMRTSFDGKLLIEMGPAWHRQSTLADSESKLAKLLIGRGVPERELAKITGIGGRVLTTLYEMCKDDKLIVSVDKALEECGMSSALSRLVLLKAFMDAGAEEQDLEKSGSSVAAETSRLMRLTDIKVTTFFEWFPVLNLFYDLFFDEIPSSSQIKELVNIIIIISGLLIGSATALYAAIDFEQMQTAIERYSNTEDVSWSLCFQNSAPDGLIEPTKSRCASLSISGADGTGSGSINRYATETYWLGPAAVNLIENFGFCSNCATGFLGASLLMALIIYLFTTNTSFAVSLNSADEDVRLVGAWWPYSRWVALSMILNLFAGVLFWMRAYVTLVLIKFPSRIMEEFSDWPKRPDATYTPYLSAYNFLFVVGPMGIIALLLMSLGLANKYRVQRLLRAREGRKG